MADTFEPEERTDPQGQKTLFDVYKVAQRGVDLGLACRTELGLLHTKLDRALKPIAFPRGPLWAGVGVLFMLVLSYLAVNHDAVTAIAR